MPSNKKLPQKTKRTNFLALIVLIILISAGILFINLSKNSEHKNQNTIKNESLSFCNSSQDCKFTNFYDCVSVTALTEPCQNACMTQSFLNWIGKSCRCVESQCKVVVDKKRACNELCAITERYGCNYGSYGRTDEALEGLRQFNCSQYGDNYNCCNTSLQD